jgi:DNA-binding MarR family transcriptional regulator
MTRTRQSAVSTVVARLVRHGLVCRLPSPRDRRLTCLTLTPRARLLVKRAPQSPTARLIAALDRLTEPQVRALGTGLTALATGMGLDLAAPALLFEEATLPSRNGRRTRLA